LEVTGDVLGRIFRTYTTGTDEGICRYVG